MMPDDYRHPVEEELQRWSSDRCAAFGAPLELHPADRKRLQDEVASVYGHTATPPRRSAGWLALWPRFAIAGGICALLAIASWRAFSPPGELGLAKVSEAESLGREGEEPTGLAPVIPSAEPMPLPDRAQAPALEASRDAELTREADERRDRVVPEEPGAPGERLAARESLAAPTAGVPSRTTTAEPNDELLRNRYGLGQSPTSQALARQSQVDPSPTSTPPALEETAVATRRLSIEAARTELRPTANDTAASWAPDLSVPLRPSRSYRANFNSPPLETLQNFRFEKAGDQVRVIDADGSTYTGNIIDPQSLSAGPAPVQQLQVLAQTSNSAAFTVSGTQQDSGAPVLFQGVVTTGQAVRIRGQANIGERTRVEVDAASSGE
jgi:hypothetical protein